MELFVPLKEIITGRPGLNLSESSFATDTCKMYVAMPAEGCSCVIALAFITCEQRIESIRYMDAAKTNNKMMDPHPDIQDGILPMTSDTSFDRRPKEIPFE